MMHPIIRALAAYLQDCGLPLYLTDAVPTGQDFPYLTAEASAPFAPDKRGSLILTLWCAGGMVNTTRLMLHDSLMQHFPARGLCLETEAGLAVLLPGTARAVQQGEAMGVETALALRFFPGEQGG